MDERLREVIAEIRRGAELGYGYVRIPASAALLLAEAAEKAEPLRELPHSGSHQ